MRFDVITLFPDLFEPFLRTGITRRAFESEQVQVCLHNLRDHAEGNYRRVDDRPFGGGPGMVMMAEPLTLALAHAQAQRSTPGKVILFSPLGRVLDHAIVQRWAVSEGAVLLCGRYEGLDQRFVDRYVDEQISLGDFVVSGGELPAMLLLDAIARLQPEVLSDAQSHQQDSFNPALDGLLDCPHYTRPEDWQGRLVPEVLLSGHHERIERWRRDQRLLLTARLRPELIAAARATGALDAADEKMLRGTL
jgi:tRNA (guanine37-N1)-methyltransferase